MVDKVTRHSSFLLCIILGLAFGTYFVMRYSGFWSGGDTAVFLITIINILKSGTIYNEHIYSHGYAYQIWAATLTLLSGMSAQDLITVYGPIVGCLIMALMGYTTFRVWLNSDKNGLIATSFLFLTAELYFSVARGNHEKLTVFCTLFACFCIVKSFNALAMKRLQVFIMWGIVYYIVVFTLASLNTTWASSFVVATTLATIFATILLLIKPSIKPILSSVRMRLILVASTSWLLIVVIFWYVYPISSSVFSLLQRVTERVGVLALSLTPEANPYEYSTYAWVNPSIYHLLSIFRYLLFAGSFLTAITLVIKIIRYPNKVPLRLLLLIAFYGAFGLELLIALIIDLVDTGVGNNLQVRLYNYFALFAAPMLSIGLWNLALKKPLLKIFISITLTLMIPLSLLKSLQDPLVSNLWVFYNPTEIRAIEFWRDQIEYGALWIGSDGRRLSAYSMKNGHYRFGAHKVVSYGTTSPSSFVQFTIISDLILQASHAQSIAPPNVLDDHLLYSNGIVDLYKETVQTPFQK